MKNQAQTSTIHGKVIIFSAPSGSGKTTLVRHLLENNPDLSFSISASTREKRGRTEQHGKDYYFLSPEEFKLKIDNDEFIEWEQVYEGNFYGTLKSEIQRLWNEGQNVVFDVDVKGGMSLKKYFGDDALAIFVKAPSEEVLRQRLINRNTETEEVISRRLYKVKFESGFADQFDVVLVNDDLEGSFAEAQKLYSEFIK